MTKTAAVYARISIATEESVSVARQIASGRKYAAARGWKVVGEFVDDGVSATRVKPGDRPGWKALLASVDSFDAVVIWKVDRLARRVTDFLHAHESLLAHDAAIVCVEQSIDMTTGEGRAFAQMLAVFGELEAAAISARMTAGRAHLLATGRSPGGLQPYGWRIVPNPNGPGHVRAQDPERIEWVREMAIRALRGDRVNAIFKWLSESDAPPPRGRAPGQRWHYTTVDHLLRNPVLAGLVPCNPGNGGGARGPEVLREADGTPVVQDDVAIISVAEHEALVHSLTRKDHHAARGKPRRQTSPLLAKFVMCGECDVLLYRHHQRTGPALQCRQCRQIVSRHLLMAYVERRLFAERGEQPMHRRVVVVQDDPATSIKLARVDDALRSAVIALTADTADVPALSKEIIRLKKARARARLTARTAPVDVLTEIGSSLQEVWQSCTSEEQRRDILNTHVSLLSVTRGRSGGRGLDESRVEIVWNQNAEFVVPAGLLRATPHVVICPPAPWISHLGAAELAGSQ